jgi:hypothetical protein
MDRKNKQSHTHKCSVVSGDWFSYCKAFLLMYECTSLDRVNSGNANLASQTGDELYSTIITRVLDQRYSPSFRTQGPNTGFPVYSFGTQP